MNCEGEGQFVPSSAQDTLLCARATSIDSNDLDVPEEDKENDSGSIGADAGEEFVKSRGAGASCSGISRDRG